MMAKKNGQEPSWSETPVESLDFGERGVWKIRGLLAEEDFMLQDKYMTVDVRTGKTNIDTAGMRFALISKSILESPHGCTPPVNVLKKIPSGMANRILEMSKKLSNPEVDVEKN